MNIIFEKQKQIYEGVDLLWYYDSKRFDFHSLFYSIQIMNVYERTGNLF